MNRRAIPSFAFHEYGEEELRRRGVMVIPLDTSITLEPARLRPHVHEFFQVFWVEGRTTLMHDFREYHLKGKAVVFVNPGQVHTLKRRPGMGGMQISFTQEFYDHRSPPPSGLIDLPFFFQPDAVPCLPVPEADGHRIGNVFAELQREYDLARPWAEDALRSLLHLLFVRVRRHFAEVHPASGTSRGAQVARQFYVAVEHHFREDWPVAEYARQLHLTANHLNDTVQEQTGHSAGEIIRRRKLLDAQRLLLHSDLNVAEIAYQLGFPDPSYFSRFFRRMAQKGPAAFREEIREKYHRNAS
jgi:AraC family transcriptional activator of pobA